MIKKRLCYNCVHGFIPGTLFFEVLRNDKLVISNTSKLLHQRVILR